jgi:DNA repair protein RadC
MRPRSAKAPPDEPIRLRPVALLPASSGASRRLARVGSEAAEPSELVAALLGCSVTAAASTLEAAGGLLGLSAATDGEIARLAQVARPRAARLAAAFELGRRTASVPTEPGWRIRTPLDVAERLGPAMRHLVREELRVLTLNTKNVVMAATTLYVGNLAGSSVRVGEVFRDAVRRQAAAVVVVHNHPSGDPTPSADDLRITAELQQAGRLLDIELLDHVVVAADRWISVRGVGIG